MFVLWHRHTFEKALTTNIPLTFFSDVNFLNFFYSTKRMSKRIKLCQKKIGHQPCLGGNRKQTKFDPSTTRLPDSKVSLSLLD